MKTIIQKIGDLQQVARKPYAEFAEPGDGGFDDYLRKSKVLEELMEDLTKHARADNSTVGRRISFPVMDGRADYVVTHMLKNDKVLVQWVMMDEAYIDDRLGERGVLDLEFVQGRLAWEDQISNLKSVS